MRIRSGNISLLQLLIVAVGAASLVVGCAARKPSAQLPKETFVPTAVPTVPPSGSVVTPTAERTPPPTPRRKAKPGEPIGPEIVFFGTTRADGTNVDPESVDKNGIAIYKNYVGSGFQLVVEAKPGLSGLDVDRRVFVHSPTDPKMRPSLQIEVSRPMGDGSTAVCDRSRPRIGGIPAINPASFAAGQKISDALNDLGCRFEVFTESDTSCSLDKSGDWSFKKPDETTVQYCMMVARAWNFPVGETMVTARVLDRAGNPGPVKKIKLWRPKNLPTPVPRPTPLPTPKGLPVRP